MARSVRQQSYLRELGVLVWRERGSQVSVEQVSVEKTRTRTDTPSSGASPGSDSVPSVEQASPPPSTPPPSLLVTGELAQLGALKAQVSQCTACELHKGRTQTVFGVGDPKSRCMVIGEGPGAEEDRQGEPFVGRAGKLLNAMLRAMGFEREQVYIANIVKCRPPNNRDPRPEETAACAQYLNRQIELVSPEVIVAVGRVAAQNLLGSTQPIGRMRGGDWRYLHRIPVVVTYHPAYLLRSPLEKRKAWEDLKRVRATLGMS